MLTACGAPDAEITTTDVWNALRNRKKLRHVNEAEAIQGALNVLLESCLIETIDNKNRGRAVMKLRKLALPTEEAQARELPVHGDARRLSRRIRTRRDLRGRFARLTPNGL